MTTTTATRPASFDARLMAYLPALTGTALAIDRANKDDLVQETIAWALDKWQNFHGDIDAPNSGFYRWINLNMRAIAQGHRRRKSSRMPHVDVLDVPLAVQPSQHDSAELAEVMRTLDGMDEDTRLTVLACASGEAMVDIAARMGTTKAAVNTRVVRARVDLAARFPRKRRPYPGKLRSDVGVRKGG